MGIRVTWFYNNPNRAPFGEARTWQSEYVGLPRAVEVGINGLKRVAPRAAFVAGHAYSDHLLQRALKARKFDLVHVHTLHNSYWNHDTISLIGSEVPTVWSFHDCWNFSAESEIYEDLDGKTVRLKPDGSDREAATARKRAYFEARPKVQLVANSRFTAAYAARLLGRDVGVIPYGLPLDLLSPIEKTVARQALHIPPDVFVVGFIADVRNDTLKGFAVLRRALERLDSANVHAIAIGEGQAGDERIGQVSVRSYGRIASPAILAILYSAADVFVVPSLAESLGMVGMESIACGTPVIGSDVGGIPDVVRPGSTGWLFPKGGSDRLAEVLMKWVPIARGLPPCRLAAWTRLAASGARRDRRSSMWSGILLRVRGSSSGSGFRVPVGWFGSDESTDARQCTAVGPGEPSRAPHRNCEDSGAVAR